MDKLLLHQVFLKLPVKSLLICKIVCKLWNSIVSSPHFSKLYIKQSSFSNEERVLINTKTCFLSFQYENHEDCNTYTGRNCNISDDFEGETETPTEIPEKNFLLHADHPDVFVVASCNGLVCLDSGDGCLYVWNPTTFEHTEIPYPSPRADQRRATWGFGCVSLAKDDYKLVRIPDLSLKIIQVFSFIGNSWKTISLNAEDLAYDVKLFMGSGVRYNDMICWAINWLYDHDALEASGWDIIGFDLSTEEFKTVCDYDQNFPYGFSNCPLLMSSKEGCLNFCLQSDEGEFSIWSYKHEEEEKRSKFSELSYFRHVSFSMYERFMIAEQMLGLTKTGRYVFHLDNGSIVFLHPEQQQPTDDVHLLRIPKTSNVIKYVESLVSPLRLLGVQHFLINTKTCFLSFDFASYKDDSNYISSDYEIYNFEGNTETVRAIPESDIFPIHALHPLVLPVASCHGLVYLDSGDGALYVWNPVTNVRVQIPNPEPRSVWGLGCESSTEHYKLIREPEFPLKKVQVFSFVGDCWKTITLDSSAYGYDIPSLERPGVWFNNMLCWVDCWLHVESSPGSRGWNIIGFDLAGEKFVSVYELVKFLPLSEESDAEYPVLFVKEGCLHLCLQSDDGEIEIGFFKKEETNSFTWLFRFIRDSFSFYGGRAMFLSDVFGVTKTGRYVIHLDQKSILLLDPNLDPEEDLHFLKIPTSTDLITYVPSLISPFLLGRNRYC